MLNYDEVKEKIDSIIQSGDTVKSAPLILELNDMITKSEAEDKATLDELNSKIEDLTEENTSLTEEVSSIREANADVMLKYGAVVKELASNVHNTKKKEKEEDDDEDKFVSWADIAKMD